MSVKDNGKDNLITILFTKSRMVHNKCLSKSKIFCARPLPSSRLTMDRTEKPRQHEETFIRGKNVLDFTYDTFYVMKAYEK